MIVHKEEVFEYVVSRIVTGSLTILQNILLLTLTFNKIVKKVYFFDVKVVAKE